MISWALLRCKCVKEAWDLFDHGKCIDAPLTPSCFEALLMESEQDQLFEHECALLRGLQDTVFCDAAAAFEVGTCRVRALNLAKRNEMVLHEGSLCESGNASFACMWCICSES
eukprot:gnl/TRDRNA2_/TRDRNA2_78990_c0_seq1.p1 gnl/TRDRNA2_/TRDRNA2_78990_c0~~gnl/TRDRNA2_/TRDRNA2_78990_c0_seq1.p1  ORF type:complete len:113 (-),score=11.49 gnl/TRDRNA2_/TRDRNA2_78990_c0_seq1:331-669(-)